MAIGAFRELRYDRGVRREECSLPTGLLSVMATGKEYRAQID